jgi:hypothetical protein
VLLLTTINGLEVQVDPIDGAMIYAGGVLCLDEVEFESFASWVGSLK